MRFCRIEFKRSINFSFILSSPKYLSTQSLYTEKRTKASIN
nr:MAG TPA: hypothetical protein [Caudoviricetes sp.]